MFKERKVYLDEDCAIQNFRAVDHTTDRKQEEEKIKRSETEQAKALKDDGSRKSKNKMPGEWNFDEPRHHEGSHWRFSENALSP